MWGLNQNVGLVFAFFVGHIWNCVCYFPYFNARASVFSDYGRHKHGVLKSPLVMEERRCPLPRCVLVIHVKPLSHRRCLGSQQPQSHQVQEEEETVPFWLPVSFRSPLPPIVMANSFFKSHSTVRYRLFPRMPKATRIVRSLSYLPWMTALKETFSCPR